MRYSVFSAVALATLATAQTFTTCDPTKKTCSNDAALGRTVTVDFTKGASSEFFLAEGTSIKYGADGAEFTINKDGQAPTITSNWYIFFGKVEVVMKAAPGVGIVSSFVMESDDLDEVDWEWLGGDLKQVQTNYFGKGNTTTYDRGTYVALTSAHTDFHTYTIDWKSSSIVWSIDGAVVRTLNYGDANGGKNFPQTPMQIKMGNWVGGSPTGAKGTVEWAGGLTDFTKAPFTMTVKSVTISDSSTGGKSYVYSDMSGDWQSIKTSNDAGSVRGGGNVVSSPSSASGSASASASGSASTVPSSNSTKTTDSIEPTTTSKLGSGNLGAGAVTADPGTSTAGSSFVVSSSKTSASTTNTASTTSSSTSATSTPNAGGRNGANFALAGAALVGYLIL